MKIDSNGEDPYTLIVKNGEFLTLKDSNINIKVERLKFNSLELSLPPPSSESILVSHNPKSFTDSRLNDYQFSLINITSKETTTLKIVKDPGKNLIWYASFFMLFGFSIMFFVPYRQIWLRVHQKGGKYNITIAGSSNKNLASFKETFNTIVRSLQETLCEEA